MMWGNWDGGWMMLFGGLMMVLFWGGLIVLAVLVLRAVIRPPDTGGRQGNGDSTALETLKLRFARGEITAAEYEEARRVLEA